MSTAHQVPTDTQIPTTATQVPTIVDQMQVVSNQMSTKVATVVTIDDEPPNITCIADMEVGTDTGKPTAVVEWQKPTTTDNSGDIVNITCSPESGTEFTIGQTNVTCEAVDMSGNRAACSFNVSITGMWNIFIIIQNT